MRQRRVYEIILSFLLINIINAQLDPTLCPNGPTISVDPKWQPIPSRFEIMTELVSSDQAIELSQAFSTQRDAILLGSKSGPIQLYWSFVTDEQFEVVTAIIENRPIPQCFRQPIQPGAQTSVIQPKTLIVKPSVLLGYDNRNVAAVPWGVTYIGDVQLRGIPTMKFKSCFFVRDIAATVSAVYYISDASKFQSYLAPNVSIILQIDAEVKAQDGRSDIYSYNVFRYTPNPRRQEERQALETPGGVFCPNRTQTQLIPTNIPERVASNGEVILPEANSTIISTHGLYDTEFQVTRFDYWFPDPTGGSNWEHYTEIHDFAVGLSFQYNYAKRQCSVTDLTTNFNDGVIVDGKPNIIQMGSPQHMFLMDDMEYQYTGEKPCRDRVTCHVWIGQNQLPNNTVQQREWYWASRMNGEELQPWIPMKMVIKNFVNQRHINTIESTVFDFRRNPMTIFEIDYTLSECYRAMGPAENYNLAVLSFQIDNKDNYPVLQNFNSLRRNIFESLIFTLFVRPTRISNLVVDQDDKSIVVTFTLLDAPPRTGPVETPLQETKLDELTERLSTVIDANALAVRATSGSKQVVLRARPKSLNVVSSSTETKKKSSGPQITGFWIGFIIAGLVIGIAGAIFVFERLTK